jgi:site-specific recombinase XerD
METRVKKATRIYRMPDSEKYQWNTVTQAFLDFKAATHASSRTICDYKSTLKLFMARTNPDLGSPVSLRNAVLKFLSDYENPYSYNRNRAYLKAFFNWCMEEGIVRGKNPVRGMPCRTLSPRIRHLDEETLKALLRQPDKREYSGFRDYTMMLMMLDCGIRPGESLRLLPGDCDIKQGTVHVKAEIAKNRTQRILSISTPTSNAIGKLLESRHPLWQNHVPVFCSRDGAPMVFTSWNHRFKKYVRQANLDNTITSYDLRHTFAIMFLRNGGNLFALKTIMGHRRLEMTERYARFVGQDVTKEHEKASPVIQLLSKRVRQNTCHSQH